MQVLKPLAAIHARNLVKMENNDLDFNSELKPKSMKYLNMSKFSLYNSSKNI